MDLAWGGVGLLLIILFFQLITLPVELDASKRALTELQKLEILEEKELSNGKDMLQAAAMTYFASLATTLLEILRFVLIIAGRDDRK